MAQEYKLSDAAIAQIVQLIQLGILTGTDISDQIRTLTMSVNKKTNKLEPAENFVSSFNENLSKLQRLAEETSANEQ